MAITRAQQFRQMLEDGGRLGYRFGGGYQGSDAKTGKGGASKGPSKGGGSKKDDRDPGDRGRGSIPFRSKTISEAEKKAQRDKFRADSKTFARNLKPESGLSKIIRRGGFIPTLLSGITDSEFNKKRRAAFMKDLDALSKRFQTRRNINLPFGIGSFDANARINNNLLQNLLNEAQEDLGLVAMSPGPFDYMNKRAISLSDLPKDKQDEIYDKVMDARMAGQTDAAGNLAPGFMFDAQGNIISTGNDGRDTEAERLALLAQATNQNQATAPEPVVDPTMFRFLNRGGMVEDAPMGTGIMDLEAARQMMFIGGIAKGIKKGLKGVTRAAKKVFKSPFGKAALLAAPFAFSPAARGAVGSFFGKGSFNPFLRKVAGDTAFSGLGEALSKIGLVNKSGGLTAGGIGSLFGITSLLAALQKPKEDENFDLESYYEKEGLRDFIASLGQRNRFLAEGGKAEPVAKKTMPLLDLDGQEMDFRAEGGFVPIGRMEKADDVPARLSKNEFVFTAEAVRNAGDGDVDNGAEVMYNTMKNLEAGGTMSEESQGQDGAKEMFQTAQRLEGVM